MVTDLFFGLADLLARVPATYWSAFGTAALGLITLKFSNGHAARQLQRQLDHQTAQREAERISTLKKECYIPAASHLVKVNAIIGSLPQIDLSKFHERNEMSEFSAAIVRLQMVCDPATALLAGQIMAAYSTALIRCLPKASAIQHRVKLASINQNFYNDQQQEVKRLLAVLNNRMEDGKFDQDEFVRIQRAIDFFSDQANNFEKARQKYAENANNMLIEYLRFAQELLSEIGRMNIKLFGEIRKELGFSGEDPLLQELFKGQFDSTKKAIDSALEEIKETMVS